MTEPAASDTLSVPLELNWPVRLNWAVWSSSQVTLVTFTGESGLMSEPERTRSVAATVALFTGAGEAHDHRRGRGRDVRVARWRDPCPGHERGRDHAEGAADGLVPGVPSGTNSKAPTSRGP